MFTGIVEEMGTVNEIARGSKSITIKINSKRILNNANIGDSIAVNGICLTVTNLGDSWFSADVMPETMRKTGLDELKVSDKVSLERALLLSDRLGGHIVSGHIDGTGTVIEKKEEKNAIWLTITAPEEILRYVVMKGSIALDGASLTVAYVDNECFKVSIIPLTAGNTTLGYKKEGDKVNIECDILGKYVEKFLNRDKEHTTNKKDMTIDFLRDNGFA